MYVDIAGRRLTIRAAETDANEGVLGVFVAHFPLFFFLQEVFYFILFYFVGVSEQLNLRHRIRHQLKMVQALISFSVLKELPKKQ